MKYIIMCGGAYKAWETPRHLTMIKGEPIVARTIRLLRDNGVEDIAISTSSDAFKQFGVELLRHENGFTVAEDGDTEKGLWVEAFYNIQKPACYIFGDVVFSPAAIKKIVETDTDSVEFFASSKPLAPEYPKRWAEPFAFKVKNQKLFWEAIRETEELHLKHGAFKRSPIAWELWQVIKGTPLNHIDYTNYTAINDYTCDIDDPEDIKKFEAIPGI